MKRPKFGAMLFIASGILLQLSCGSHRGGERQAAPLPSSVPDAVSEPCRATDLLRGDAQRYEKKWQRLKHAKTLAAALAVAVRGMSETCLHKLDGD